MNAQAAAGVRWDLADLYSSPDAPNLEADLSLALQKAETFQAAYRPLEKNLLSPSPDPLKLAALLADYKAIQTLLTRIVVYAHLRFAENTGDSFRGAFFQKIQERVTDIQTCLLFWDVEWCRLDAARVSALLAHSQVAPDRHYLENLRLLAPHTLTESEEKILAVKNNTSRAAFSRLFDETVNRIPFFVDQDSVRVKKTESEVLALLHSPDRATRKHASESLAEGLSNHAHLLTFVFNMILADHRTAMKLRDFHHPMDARNLANEADLAVILRLMESVRGAYPLAQRYYRLKTRLLNLDHMADYDRYATLAPSERVVPFEECRRIVVQSYQSFSPEAGRIVQLFFEKKWIDAEIREGKQGGGFCCQTTPDLHPYILVNYTGNIRDVMTVAHELGHGLHQYLARPAGILESDAPLTLAETASVFGEMLVFDRIFSEETDPKKRLALLCGKIDDQFATVFRQIAMTDFELHAHEAGLKEGELSEDRLNALWMKTHGHFYGESVTLSNSYRHGWKYIPHFVHSPFYCYAYAFAQLFVLSLYRIYKTQKGDFVERYLQMLSLGGSQKPEQIAAGMNLDIRDPEFWKAGLSLLEEMVSEAERLSGLGRL